MQLGVNSLTLRVSEALVRTLLHPTLPAPAAVETLHYPNKECRTHGMHARGGTRNCLGRN